MIAQGVGFFGFHGQDPPVPLEHISAVLCLIGWLTVAAYLLYLRFALISSIGGWIGALGFGATALAALGMWLDPPTSASEPSVGAWPHAHIILSAAGFAVLALASLAGGAYLAKERALRTKRPPALRLPSLESLDRVVQLALSLGFPLLTLGVITGVLWSFGRVGPVWTGHSVFLLSAWLVYLVPVTFGLVRRQHGQAIARSAVIGFAVLAVAYLGVRLWGVAV
jgi:ABC-type uncharacterized transport system permease subunit